MGKDYILWENIGFIHKYNSKVEKRREMKNMDEEDISEINEEQPSKSYGGCSCGDNIFSQVPQKDSEDVSLGDLLEKNTFLEDITLQETNGSKSYCTGSLNFHRKHVKLSKKLSELENRITKNEIITSIILSRYPAEYWYKASKRYGRVLEQKRLIKTEKEKLEVLKKECVEKCFQ